MSRPRLGLAVLVASCAIRCGPPFGNAYGFESGCAICPFTATVGTIDIVLIRPPAEHGLRMSGNADVWTRWRAHSGGIEVRMLAVCDVGTSIAVEVQGRVAMDAAPSASTTLATGRIAPTARWASYSVPSSVADAGAIFSRGAQYRAHLTLDGAGSCTIDDVVLPGLDASAATQP